MAIEVAKDIGYHVSMMDLPLTIGEDFSGYTETYPGVFAFIGSNSGMTYIILYMIQMSVF